MTSKDESHRHEWHLIKTRSGDGTDDNRHKVYAEFVCHCGVGKVVEVTDE